MWKESTCAQGGRENILRSPFKDQNRSNQGKRYIDGACIALCVPCSPGTELSAIHWGWGRAPHGHGGPGRTSALQEQRWDTRKVASQAVVWWSRWGLAIAWAVEREKPGCQYTSVAGEELGHGQVTLQPFPPGQQPPGWCAASGADHRVLHPTRSVCIGKGFLLLWAKKKTAFSVI